MITKKINIQKLSGNRYAIPTSNGEKHIIKLPEGITLKDVMFEETSKYLEEIMPLK